MPVATNYLLVLLIWSTTPLAIKVSIADLSIYESVVSRMLIGFVLGAILIAAWQKESAFNPRHWPLYLVAAMPVVNMLMIYEASKYLSSGMVAVLFSLTPIISGILARFILNEAFFCWNKLIALVLAFCGLVLIFSDNLELGQEALQGTILMLISNVFFSLSQVLTKLYSSKYPAKPLEQTFGALAVALPVLIFAWFLFDGSLPKDVDSQSLYAVFYLGAIGSLLGFMAYFFILDKLSVGLISLIPLITPVLALWLGSWLLDEIITQTLLIGSGCIVAGLVLYDGNLLKKIL